MRKVRFSSRLLRKISLKNARIGVIGAGFVGQALATAFARVGLEVWAVDIDENKVCYVNNLGIKKLRASTKFLDLALCDILCICIPTPVDENKNADYRTLSKVIGDISNVLSASKKLIVLESSVAPGTCRNLILPLLEKSGLEVGQDFFFAHSPERIDPGNRKFTIKNTPKVVGANDKSSLKLASLLYSKICDSVVEVSSLEVAEMVKVLENTFRLVNISLVNEFAHFAKKVNVDIWDVIEAASTKPYGFLAHFPGPGIGGDCIPVVPYHLVEAAKKSKVRMAVVEASLKVNELQPTRVVERVKEVLRSHVSGEHKSKVMLVGVSYKEGVADLRQSAALKIWQGLEKEGIDVSYHDPFVPRINGYSSVEISNQLLEGLDAIVVTTAHKNVEYKSLVSAGKPVIDTRNILSKYRQAHIIKL